MPIAPPAITRFRPLRRPRAPRREVRRFLTHADLTRIALANVPAAQRPKAGRDLPSAWTLYWRARWSLDAARTERARRRARPFRY
jgi:hypothetical protein